MFWEQVKEIASTIGRVLHVPKPIVNEGKSVKKAHILSDWSQDTPYFLELDMPRCKAAFHVFSQPFPDAYYKCKALGNEHAK